MARKYSANWHLVMLIAYVESGVFDDLCVYRKLLRDIDFDFPRMGVPRAYRLALPLRIRFSDRPTPDGVGALLAEFALKRSYDRDYDAGLDLDGVQRRCGFVRHSTPPLVDDSYAPMRVTRRYGGQVSPIVTAD
jgi:hypothetical protein